MPTLFSDSKSSMKIFPLSREEPLKVLELNVSNKYLAANKQS